MDTPRYSSGAGTGGAEAGQATGPRARRTSDPGSLRHVALNTFRKTYGRSRRGSVGDKPSLSAAPVDSTVRPRQRMTTMESRQGTITARRGGTYGDGFDSEMRLSRQTESDSYHSYDITSSPTQSYKSLETLATEGQAQSLSGDRSERPPSTNSSRQPRQRRPSRPEDPEIASDMPASRYVGHDGRPPRSQTFGVAAGQEFQRSSDRLAAGSHLSGRGAQSGYTAAPTSATPGGRNKSTERGTSFANGQSAGAFPDAGRRSQEGRGGQQGYSDPATPRGYDRSGAPVPQQEPRLRSGMRDGEYETIQGGGQAPYNRRPSQDGRQRSTDRVAPQYATRTPNPGYQSSRASEERDRLGNGAPETHVPPVPPIPAQPYSPQKASSRTRLDRPIDPTTGSPGGMRTSDESTGRTYGAQPSRAQASNTPLSTSRPSGRQDQGTAYGGASVPQRTTPSAQQTSFPGAPIRTPTSQHPLDTTRPSPTKSTNTNNTTATAVNSRPSPTTSKPAPRPAANTTAPAPSKNAAEGRDRYGASKRPPLATSASQMDTQYVNMLLAVDSIPRMHNIAASFFTWVLLAGFILFPGTFTSLQNAAASGSTPDRAVLDVVNHVGLFVVGWICTGIGSLGMLWLWWRWHKNYIWLSNRIFMPGFMNSIAGVVSTLANVYGVQHGTFSTTSKSTIIVTGVVSAICGILFGIYGFWLLRGVKKQHDRTVGKERAGQHGEGFIDTTKRKASERQPEAGMI